MIYTWVYCKLLQKTEVLNIINIDNIYGLLTKCEVKMAGYWSGSCFCVLVDRDGVEVHKLLKKEQTDVFVRNVLVNVLQ